MSYTIKSDSGVDIFASSTAFSSKEALEEAAKDRKPLSYAALSSEKIQGADLAGIDLNFAHLNNANLQGSDLKGANLRSATLKGANLKRVDLRKANLVRVCLENADLEDAILEGASLHGANLKGANLTGARIEGIKGYGESLEVLREIISRKGLNALTNQDWAAAGAIMVLGLRWPEIIELGGAVLDLFEKVALWGFPEYFERYNKETGNSPGVQQEQKS